MNSISSDSHPSSMVLAAAHLTEVWMAQSTAGKTPEEIAAAYAIIWQGIHKAPRAV